MEAEQRRVRPGCRNAANPFHVCGDHCGQRSQAPRLKIEGGRSPVQYGERVKDRGGSKAGPDCVNASNPFHQCSDYCIGRTTGSKKHYSTGNSGNFFPVLKLSPKSSRKGSDAGKSAQSGERLRVEGRNVDPSCINASNPFHQCGNYCSKKASDANRKSMVAAQTGERLRVEGRNVNPNCTNVSNRFHQCGDYCNKKASDANRLSAQFNTVNTTTICNEVQNMGEGRRVDRMCANASNPFHQCAEYCSQRTPDAMRRTNEHTKELNV